MKEVVYISKLLDSKYTKRFPKRFDIESGTLTDFEKVCGVGAKNFAFRKWIKKIGILEPDGNGKYFIRGTELVEVFRKLSYGNTLYESVRKVVLDGFL